MKTSPRTVPEMVEEQIHRWRARQRERLDPTPASSPPLPLITISREAASGGTEIGRLVAERLGFTFWDQELVHSIAAMSGVTEGQLTALDERTQSAFEEIMSASLTGEHATHYNYMRRLREVVQTVRRHGGAVIIGRGAQFILEESECLRVRVICPFEKRVSDFAQREGLSLEHSGVKVREVEQARRKFNRKTFDVDVTDPQHYDLIVNSGRLSLPLAADVVLAAYEAKFRSDRPPASRESHTRLARAY